MNTSVEQGDKNSIPIKVRVLDDLGGFDYNGRRNPVMLFHAGHESNPFFQGLRLFSASYDESVLDKGIHII